SMRAVRANPEEMRDVGGRGEEGEESGKSDVGGRGADVGGGGALASSGGGTKANERALGSRSENVKERVGQRRRAGIYRGQIGLEGRRVGVGGTGEKRGRGGDGGVGKVGRGREGVDTRDEEEVAGGVGVRQGGSRSEEHTSELQSLTNLVC